MKSYLKFNSDFIPNVLTFMTGITLSQLIPIIISPILSRIYTPDDFGTYALFTSIASIIAVFATGRYELAIVLPEKDRDAINLVRLSMCIACIVGIIILVVDFIFNIRITNVINKPEISSSLRLIAPYIIITGFYQTLSYWFNRKKEYKKLGSSRIIQNTSMSIVQLAGFIGILSKKINLIIGFILGQLISMLYLLFQYSNISSKNVFNKREIIEKLKIYKEYPLKNIVGALINTLATQLPIFLIGYYYSAKFVGIYLIAARVLNIPMIFIGDSFSQVFYQKSTEKIKDKLLYSFVKKNTIVLFILIFIPMIIIILWGKDLFKIVFGNEWIESGRYAQILAPMIMVRFVYSCQSSILMITNRLGYQVIFSLILIILQLCGFLIGFYLFRSEILSVFFLSVAGVLVYGYNLFWILNVSKNTSMSLFSENF